MMWSDGFLSKENANVVAECRQRFGEHIEQYRVINRRAVQLQIELDVPKGPTQPLLVAALFLRTLGHLQGTFPLIQLGMPIQARVLLRAAMESIFTLRACADKEGFAEKFVNADEVNRKNFLRKAQELKGSGFLQEVVDSATPERLAEIQTAIDASQAQQLTTRDTAIAAGLYPWYLSVYSLFSSTVHSRVRSLEHHLTLDDSGNPGHLHNDPDLSQAGELLNMAADMSLVAMECAAKHFKVDCQTFIEEQRKVLHTRIKAAPQKHSGSTLTRK